MKNAFNEKICNDTYRSIIAKTIGRIILIYSIHSEKTPTSTSRAMKASEIYGWNKSW